MGTEYAMYKGFKKKSTLYLDICAAHNLKNIAIKNDNIEKKPLTLLSISNQFIKISIFIIKIYL